MRITLVVLAAMTLVPMSAGALTEIECAAVYDSVGTRVGRAADVGGQPRVLFEHEGRVVFFQVSRKKIESIESVLFTEANCMGDAFIHHSGRLSGGYNVVGTNVWYPDLLAPAATLDLAPALSKLDTFGVCTDGSFIATGLVPAFTFTLPTFVPIFHLEPEPCSTVAVASLGTRALLALCVLFACGAIWRMRRVDAFADHAGEGLL